MSEGARLSNWLAEYSHDLMENGDLDQEASEIAKAAQWIADHLDHAPSPDQPVAWIAFAGNGNVCFWTSDPHRAQREREGSLDLRAFTMVELIALISRKPDSPVGWGNHLPGRIEP